MSNGKNPSDFFATKLYTIPLPLIKKIKMKIILTFVLFLFTFNIIHSQEKNRLKVYESIEFPNKTKGDSIQSVHILRNGITSILKIRKKEILIDIFNDKLEKKGSISFEKNRKETYIGDFKFNDEVRVFTESYPERNILVINCYNFNISSKTKEKKEILKSKIDAKHILFSIDKSNSISASLNSKYFSTISHINHDGKIHFNVNVFDSNDFKLIYNKKYERQESQKYSIYETITSNDKDVYILGKSYFNPEKPTVINFKDPHYILDNISSLGSKNLKINPSNKHLKSLKPFLIGNNINIYGFYSEKKIGQIKGVFNFSVEKKNLKINNESFENLPKKVYEDMLGAKKSDKAKELKNFNLNYIIKDNEDSIYLLAEEFYRTSSQQGGSFPHYDDIIIVKINNKGQILWGRNIVKRDNYTNYNAFLDKGNSLHILLNSGKKLSLKNDGRVKVNQGVFESSSLYDISFTPKEGNFNFQKIQDNKDNTHYLPNYGEFVNGKFIMPNKSKKELKLMSIE